MRQLLELHDFLLLDEAIELLLRLYCLGYNVPMKIRGGRSVHLLIVSFIYALIVWIIHEKLLFCHHRRVQSINHLVTQV